MTLPFRAGILALLRQGRFRPETRIMHNGTVIPRLPAKAESATGILDIILQILAVLDALYKLVTNILGNSR